MTHQDSSSQDKLCVQLTDEKAPVLPPKKGSKSVESNEKHLEATGATSGASPESQTPHHDPPPSYSSVVSEDQMNARGACGYTPSQTSTDESSSSSVAHRLYPSAHGDPIQIAYPRYLSPISRDGARSSDATAPLSADREEPFGLVDRADHPSQQAVSRSMSDRRMLAAARDSRHPILRRHDSSSSSRPYSSYELPAITRNETQMASLRLDKSHYKKIGFKSTISGLLGLNNKYSEPRRVEDDYEYVNYEHSPSQSATEQPSSVETSTRPQSVDYSSIHGVLPEEIARVSGNECSSSAASSRSGSACRITNEKSRALSAKFGIGAKSAERCREELPLPECLSAEIKSTEIEADKKELEVEHAPHETSNDLIDLNVSDEDNINALTDSKNKLNDFNSEPNSTNNLNEFDNREESANLKQKPMAELDGNLNNLAKPRRLKSSNPFYDCTDDNSEESDNSNSASYNR